MPASSVSLSQEEDPERWLSLDPKIALSLYPLVSCDPLSRPSIHLYHFHASCALFTTSRNASSTSPRPEIASKTSPACPATRCSIPVTSASPWTARSRPLARLRSKMQMFERIDGGAVDVAAYVLSAAKAVSSSLARTPRIARAAANPCSTPYP